MQRAVRFGLLMLGAVVAVATSAKQLPELNLSLQPSELAVVLLNYSSDKSVQGQLRLELNLPYELTGAGQGGELVGFVQKAAPSQEALDALDRTRTFEVGQVIDGLGAVAFVMTNPSVASFGTPGGAPALLTSSGDTFLTLLPRGQGADVQLRIEESAMRDRCDCDVSAYLSQYDGRPAPLPALDAGEAPSSESDAGESDAGEQDAGEEQSDAGEDGGN